MLRLFWYFYADKFYRDPWQHRIFPQHHWLLKLITSHRPKTILEVGCGFGRNLKFLLDHGIKPQQLTGVDFSASLLRHINIPHIKLFQASAQKLPFPNRHFDLVFTHGLLMHISSPQRSIAELIRVSRKWLIIIEETRRHSQKLNSFTWAHDYPKLFQSLPVKINTTHHNKYNISGYEVLLSRRIQSRQA